MDDIENVQDTGRTTNRNLIRESPDRFSNKLLSGVKPTSTVRSLDKKSQHSDSPSIGISHTESQILGPDKTVPDFSNGIEEM